jgi:hypothetical protein
MVTMPFKVFTAGSALPASDGNDFLMEQQIAVFAGTAARDAAITSPIHGQFAFITSTNRLMYYNGTSWVER